MQNRYTAMKFNSQKDFRGLDGEECSYDRTKQNKQTNKNKGMERKKGKKSLQADYPNDQLSHLPVQCFSFPCMLFLHTCILFYLGEMVSV